MHSFCVYVLLLFQSPCCCLPFSFIFSPSSSSVLSPTPTTCLFQEILQDVSASAGTHFLIPIRFACWLNRPPPLSCSLSTYRRLPAACLPALGAPSSLTAPSATASSRYLTCTCTRPCSWPLILMRHGGCRFCLFMLSDFSYFLIVLLRSSSGSSSRNT